MEYVYLVFMEGVFLRVFDDSDSAVNYSNWLRGLYPKLAIRVDKEKVYGNKNL